MREDDVQKLGRIIYRIYIIWIQRSELQLLCVALTVLEEVIIFWESQ